MKKISITRLSAFCLLAVSLILCNIDHSMAEDLAGPTPISKLPANVLSQATTTFNSGMKLHIWNDSGTKLSVQSLFGQTMIFIDGISVLSNEKSGEVKFSSCARFSYIDTSTKKRNELAYSATASKPERSTASSQERRYALILFATDNGIQLSGKGSFYISLADQSNKEGQCLTPISNTVVIAVDLDKGIIIE